MLVSVLTSPHPRPGEASTINALFAAGLDQLHLRKPQMEERVIRRLLEGIHPEFHGKVVLHGHFSLLRRFPLKGLHFRKELLREGWLTAARRSAQQWFHGVPWTSATFHSPSGLDQAPQGIGHLWLSPVFKPISSPDSGYGFDPKRLQLLVSNLHRPVHALGGQNASTVLEARSMGFAGSVLQGCIWRSKDPVGALRAVLNALDAKTVETPETALAHAKSA